MITTQIKFYSKDPNGDLAEIVIAYRARRRTISGLTYQDQDEKQSSDQFTVIENNTDSIRFREYSIDWNPTKIKWALDGITYYSVNLTEKMAPYFNHKKIEFLLVIESLVTQDTLGWQDLTLQDIMDWNCSLFIIDYVRYYRWTEQLVNNTKNLTETEISSRDICDSVMPSIRPTFPLIETSFWINFMIFASILLLILFSIIVLLFILLRNRSIDMNKRSNETKRDNLYDDIEGEYYDPVYYEIDESGIYDNMESINENEQEIEEKFGIDLAKNEYLQILK